MIYNINEEDFAIKVNTLRNTLEKKSYSQAEMQSLLKEAGLPSSTNYFFSYLKYGIVLRIRRGVYTLPETPIYKGVISTALTKVREEKLDYIEKVKNQEEEKQEQEKIESCVNFLKSKGFLIYRPV